MRLDWTDSVLMFPEKVFNNVIENCGTHDYVVHPDDGGKNGEGIYVGEQTNSRFFRSSTSNAPATRLGLSSIDFIHDVNGVALPPNTT